MKFKKRKKKFDSINYNAGNVEYNNMMFNKMASSYDGSVPNADTATVGNMVTTAVAEDIEQEEKKHNVEKHGIDGAYNIYGRMYNSMKFDESKTILSSEVLREAIVGSIDKDNQGGMIVLSTDVNAVKQSDNKIIDFLKKKLETLKNRLTYKKKIDKVAKKFDETYSWTIGKYLNGRYKSKNGDIFDENSISIEILGISDDTLIKLAEELCDDFKQESVLVKDYANGQILFVNSD